MLQATPVKAASITKAALLAEATMCTEATLCTKDTMCGKIAPLTKIFYEGIIPTRTYLTAELIYFKEDEIFLGVPFHFHCSALPFLYEVS